MNQVFSLLYEPLLPRLPLTALIRVVEELRKRELTIKETGVEAPTFIFWEKQGLIQIPHENGQRRRLLTLTEYVWVCLVRELREAGVSLEAMKFMQKGLTDEHLFPNILQHLKANPQLAEKVKEADPKGFDHYIQPVIDGVNPTPPHIMDYKLSFLELLCAWFFLRRSHVSLYLLTDGAWFSLVHSPEYQPVWDHYNPLLSQITYTHVSLSRLLHHFQREEVQLRTPRLALLSPNEQKVLEIITSGEYQMVTIKFKDRKIKSITMTQTDEDRLRLLDILTEGNYQEITIRNREGMQTQIVNTERITLD